ncbi:MAG: hypothetical protein IPO66_10710 [Rhodanobacteraceae bacterium]|nr:hypothetical protein [Rhodanobacteraceae bacterium]
MAEHALAWLAREIALAAFTEAGILLAEHELARAPLHLTVVGAKDDPAAAALFRAVLAQPGSYKRVDWWDQREGPLPHADVNYPTLKRAAAFVCNDRQCSLPIFQPQGVANYLSELPSLDASRFAFPLTATRVSLPGARDCDRHAWSGRARRRRHAAVPQARASRRR